ncbi:MAG: hypothetical protein CMP76_13740 [Flavobacterium sp.]|uniref:hypothetical protein n=1 Tax=Flavobacterium sp. TaxID=239 RepID=UPI000C3860DA|nr:hypothetical protein [Flavobacterium sp.]MBF04346.1 hypothetical protein [Flavobacterium sp.]
MKKIIFLIGIVSVLVSCKIQETIAVNELNEVDLKYGFDFSPMLKLGKKEGEAKESQKAYDTVLDFRALLAEHKDSIAKLPDSVRNQLEFLADFDIHMKVDESKDIFLYEMGMKLPSFEAMSKDMNPFKSIGALSKMDKSLAMGADKADDDKENYETTYTYNERYFEKKIVSKVKKKREKKRFSENEELGDDEFSKQLKEAFKECSYVMKYTFPKKIKSVSLKNAKISEDKKSFTYEILLDDLENQEDLSFKVQFYE